MKDITLRKYLKTISKLLPLLLISLVLFVGCNSSKEAPKENEKLPTTTSSSNSPTENNTKSNKEVSTNSKTVNNTIKDVNCRIYFFNRSELKHYYIEKAVPVENNALISALTKELQNTSYNKDFLTLTDKVSIKSANVDKETGILKITFSDSYVDKMPLGTATESGLLASLLATYGYNLKVNKIIIYFKDEIYTCLGDFAEGYFKVIYPSAEKYNYKIQ